MGNQREAVRRMEEGLECRREGTPRIGNNTREKKDAGKSEDRNRVDCCHSCSSSYTFQKTHSHYL